MDNPKQLTQDTNFSNWMFFNFWVWVLAGISLLSSFKLFLVTIPIVILINWFSRLFFYRFKRLFYDENGIYLEGRLIPYENISKIVETGWSLGSRHNRQRVFRIWYQLQSVDGKCSFIPDDKSLTAFIQAMQEKHPHIRLEQPITP
jgi:hypothetical protein